MQASRTTAALQSLPFAEFEREREQKKAQVQYFTHLRDNHIKSAEMNGRLLTVTVASQYGRTVIKPHCTRAQTFAELLGQKTLTERDIGLIKKLGFVVSVKPSTPEIL